MALPYQEAHSSIAASIRDAVDRRSFPEGSIVVIRAILTAGSRGLAEWIPLAAR